MGDKEKPIIFFDDTCGLCHASVRWIIERDKKGLYSFAPMEGQTAKKLHIPLINSVILKEGDQLYFRGEALVKILNLPKCLAPLLDLPYRLIAKTRKLLFKNPNCPLSEKVNSDRFLE